MTVDAADLWILAPALVAGSLVIATHVPLGTHVLARGIVFIDLAVAQIASVGVLIASVAGLEAEGWSVQVAAVSAALLGAVLLAWTERMYPEVQEALIGVIFVLAATAAALVVGGNVHAGEHLRDVLVGQILWVSPQRLAVVAPLSAAILLVWFTVRERLGSLGFYLLFACAVTASVQLVGVYLVFASLIIPPLAVRRLARHRLAAGYTLGAFGYALGLIMSVILDLPTGPMIVWSLATVGVLVHALVPRSIDRDRPAIRGVQEQASATNCGKVGGRTE